MRPTQHLLASKRVGFDQGPLLFLLLAACLQAVWLASSLRSLPAAPSLSASDDSVAQSSTQLSSVYAKKELSLKRLRKYARKLTRSLEKKKDAAVAAAAAGDDSHGGDDDDDEGSSGDDNDRGRAVADEDGGGGGSSVSVAARRDVLRLAGDLARTAEAATLEAQGHQGRRQAEGLTYMTNTADKLLYELKNLRRVKGAPRLARPQFNPVPHKRVKEKGRPNMVIGVSSVNRRTNYLYNTIANIMERLSEEDRRHVKVVVMNGNVPPSDHTDVPRVREAFAAEMDDGLLVIEEIHGAGGHPELDVPDASLRHRWGDDTQRVRWRAKQVLDVATLMDRCARYQRYGYFLMLEDDVKVADRFPTAVRRWVDEKLSHRTDWAIASFYNPWRASDLEVIPPFKFFGVIGQLFRMHDLPHLTHFLKKNFDESPLDWLFVDYLTKYRLTMLAHSPSLFQHLGKVSSLAGKAQPSRAAEFAEFPLGNRET